MHRKIQRVSLQSEITKYIQDYIKEEGLIRGDKLPSQGEMVEIMGVSRTSLREAIKTLEAQGLLEIRNGKGVFVGSNYGNDFIQLSIGFHKEKERLLEALEVRHVLEREIIKMVVRRITEAEISELGQITDILMDKFYKKEEKRNEDRNFHYKIYMCCHNSVMYQMMTTLSDLFDAFWNDPLDIENPFEEGMPYHLELYKAIKDRNLKRALNANEEIIKDIRRELENAGIK